MKRIWDDLKFPGAAKYRSLMLSLPILFVALDQLFKYLVVTFLKDKLPIVLVEGVLELLYVENRGAAFGMLQNQQWFFILLTSVVMVFLIAVVVWGKYRQYMLLNMSFVLVLGGGIGNLIDRIAHGFVIDYIYFKVIDFPVFNFADCCLVVGAVFMLVFFFFVYEDDTKTSDDKKELPDDAEELENI